MVYNPTSSNVDKILKLPLYYTGLTDKAMIREQDGEPVEYSLDREYNADINVKMESMSITWFVIE